MPKALILKWSTDFENISWAIWYIVYNKITGDVFYAHALVPKNMVKVFDNALWTKLCTSQRP